MHPFLSGEPLQSPAPPEHAPHVIVEEPSSPFGTIEDDYVILSIPAPPAGALKAAAAGRGRGRNPSEARSGSSGGWHASGTQRDESADAAAQAAQPRASMAPPLNAGEAAFVRRCGSRLPSQLSAHEARLAAALCVAELADWKHVSGESGAAAVLSLHCASLLDALLSALAPDFAAYAAAVETAVAAVGESAAAAPDADAGSSSSSVLFDVPLNPAEGSIDAALEGYPTSEGQSGASGALTSRSLLPAGQMSTGGSGIPEVSRGGGGATVAGEASQSDGAEARAALERVLACAAERDGALCKAALLRLRVMLAHTDHLAAQAELAQVR